MASSPPAPPPKRPAYLVVALVLVWLVGLVGWMNGCHVIDTVRHPEVARELIERTPDVELARKQMAFTDTLLAHRQIVTPLAVAEFLLGSLLTFAAGTMLWGRKRARGLLLQAIIAYSAFLSVDYVLSRPVRAHEIATLLADPQLPSLGGQPGVDLPESLPWWIFRAALALRLAVLLGGLFAITRPRVRALFAASKPSAVGEQGP